MLNPDGVIVGNYRCSLFGKDLNRNYRKPKKDYFPTIWATKSMMDRLAQRCEVTLYIDMHGHSTRQNVFMYGCDSMYRDESINNYNGSGNNGTSGAFQCGLAANGAGSAGGNQSSSFNEGFLSERLFPFLMSLKVSIELYLSPTSTERQRLHSVAKSRKLYSPKTELEWCKFFVSFQEWI